VSTLDYESLREWLEAVQGYSVTPAAAQRISAVLNAALRSQAAMESGTLFWTEPSNLATTLSTCAGSEDDGNA